MPDRPSSRRGRRSRGRGLAVCSLDRLGPGHGCAQKLARPRLILSLSIRPRTISIESPCVGGGRLNKVAPGMARLSGFAQPSLVALQVFAGDEAAGAVEIGGDLAGRHLLGKSRRGRHVQVVRAARRGPVCVITSPALRGLPSFMNCAAKTCGPFQLFRTREARPGPCDGENRNAGAGIGESRLPATSRAASLPPKALAISAGDLPARRWRRATVRAARAPRAGISSWPSSR